LHSQPRKVVSQVHTLAAGCYTSGRVSMLKRVGFHVVLLSSFSFKYFVMWIVQR
jgi:hypothetical protein